MSQNGQTHFKNLAAFVDHFGTLCIKELQISQYSQGNTRAGVSFNYFMEL